MIRRRLWRVCSWPCEALPMVGGAIPQFCVELATDRPWTAQARSLEARVRRLDAYRRLGVLHQERGLRHGEQHRGDDGPDPKRGPCLGALGAANEFVGDRRSPPEEAVAESQLRPRVVTQLDRRAKQMFERIPADREAAEQE